MAKRPGGVMVQGSEPTRSQLIPVITKWEDIGKKAQLWPAIFCIAVFFALSIFKPDSVITIQTYDQGQLLIPQDWIYTSIYLIVLGVFLTTVSLWFIYKQVGKNKSWWLLFAAMGFSAYFLWLFRTQGQFVWLYEFFHNTLAGGEPDPKQPIPELFMRHLLGTGFFEEFVKAIPVLVLAWWTPKMDLNMRAKIGVEEPLDGILIGAASGGGFAIVETLGQYVSNYLSDIFLRVGLAQYKIVGDDAIKAVVPHLNLAQLVKVIQDGANMVGTSPATGALITRSLDLSFGHMAYSGYFGYFIGLSIIKPDHRWKILSIGLVSAAIPHALWDTFAFKDMTLVMGLTAILAYAILAAAILKAREISPNRSLLQPSVIFGMEPAVAVAAANVPVAVRMAPVQVAVPPMQEAVPAQNGLTAGSGNRLRVGTKYLIIAPGLRLLEHQVPGLVAETRGGPVAEVTRNPANPTVLGLTNLSTTSWETMTGSGARREIAPGQTIKLAPGTRIDFGSTDGEVA